jgi:hypothetical protein
MVEHKMEEGADWCCTLCMYDVYIFFSYSFVEFLETGKINVTVPPIFGGTAPPVTNSIFSHLAELSHPYWWKG